MASLQVAIAIFIIVATITFGVVCFFRSQESWKMFFIISPFLAIILGLLFGLFYK